MLQFYLQMIETEEDRSKFEILYHEYRQVMYIVAYGVLRHQADAEDAVQSAFVRIADRIKTIDGTICPRTQCYVTTISEHIAIDIYRKRKRQWENELPNEEVGVPFAYEGDNTLAQCLAMLSPENRDILLLKYYHGYTLKEIAKMLKITQASAASRVYRARKQLEALYEKEENQ